MKKLLSVLFLSVSSIVCFGQDPTTAASALTFTTINQTSFTINFTRGNGDYCLVVVRPSSSPVALPVDGATYNYSLTYGLGSHLGSNNYVVYKYGSSAMTISGLTAYTQYTVTLFEYNLGGTFPYVLDTYYKTNTYESDSHYTLTTEPTTQVTNLNTSVIGDDGATLTWTSGGGTYDFITVRASTANSNLPVDGTVYSSSSTFGSGSSLGSSSPYSYVVYYTTSTSVAVTNLLPLTNYVANATTYSGLSGGQNYLTAGYPTKGFTTLAAEPTGNPAWAYLTDISDTAFTVNWMKPATGPGTNALVTIKLGGTNTDQPVDGTMYTANTIYGGGTALSGGAYAVYTGTGNSVRITGLTKNTTYTAAVFEFNGGIGFYNNTHNYNLNSVVQAGTTKDKEPTAISTGLTFTASVNSISASWSNGNGDKRLVAVKPARIKTALAFDGTNDYVNVPYNANLQPTSAVTLEAWVYKSNWSTSVGWQTIAGNYNGSGYGLFLNGTTAYAYLYRNSGSAFPSTNIAHLTTGWHHFALTYDGRYTVLWVDGAKKAENDAGAIYSIQYPNANSFCIGVQAGTGATPAGLYYNGYIDEVRVWNAARSVTNIRNNMNESMMGNEANLVAEWKLDDGYVASGIAVNNSLNSTTLNGTLTNIATTAASSFVGSSGWIRSGAIVDSPVDFASHSGSSFFMSGGLIKNGYYAVYNNTGTAVTVSNLTPGTYYNFCVYDFNSTTNNNFLAESYLTGDIQTTAAPVPTFSFSPTFGNVGTLVTLTGTNFDPTAVNNIVYFGATKATVMSASATQLTVLVPYCANYVPVSVTVNSVTGTSRNPFVVTNSCFAAISGASFTTNTYTTGVTRAGTAAKDIDGDGKSDFLFVDYSNTTFSITRNQSLNGVLGWGSTYSYVTNAGPLQIITGDVDGDNKPDVLVGCNGSGVATIDIFRNQSTPGSVLFAAKVQIPSAASPGSMRLADFDRDGKLDLVVGHGPGGIVSIYRNTSSVGYISFATRSDLPALTDAFSLDVAEFNADGLIDIVVADRTANNIVFFQNNSTVGNIVFLSSISLAAASNVQCVTAGDIDNDGRPDVCAGLAAGTVRICRNQNAGGAITSANFATQYNLPAFSIYPYGIVINDLDGDQRNDIICGYALSGGISVFEQTASFTFATRQDFAGTGLVSYYLTADDFTLDGRTDIASSNYNANFQIYNSNINALSSEPVGAPSGVNITSITQTGFTVSFTAGGGANRIVVVKPSSAQVIQPVDGVGYSQNSDYSLAPDLGGGNKVVYNSNGTSVAVTNLSSNTTYNVYVYEYNGATCTANYLLSPGINSANTLNTPPTLNSISSPSAICQNSSQQSIGLTGIGTGGETQTLVLSASSSNPTLIPNGNISFTYTSPNPTGTILYTPSNKTGTSVITVTVNDGASNNNTFQRTFTVTVTPEPTVANAGSNVSICTGSTTLGGNNPSIGTGLWSFIYPGSPTEIIQTPTAFNSQITNFNVGDSVRLAWTISNSPCPASVSYVSIKRVNCPMTADFIANQTAFCGTSATVNFSDLSVTGGNTLVDWTWSFPGGTPNSYNTAVGSNPPAISYTAAGTYTVSLTITSNIPTNDSEVKNNYITITAFPGTATTINGLSAVCQGQSGVTYSVTPISGASTYSWTVPAGASINGTANTNTISVDFSAGATAGNISVTGENSCGNGSTYNRAITVNTLPGSTGVISGPTSACQGQNGVVFTVGAISGATGYNWTLPSGASIAGGVNTNSISVNFSASATDGTINVQGSNSCGSGSSSSAYGFSIDSLPLPAGVISGNTTVCPGDTVVYSISPLGYASTYTWTLPTGASIISGATTEMVTVAYSISALAGNITVRGVNACGNGTSSNAAITVNPLPSAATGILFNSGNTTVCAGSSGTISAFVSSIPNATGYSWNLPPGFTLNSGNNTNSILMSVSPTATSGTISVNGTNACGDGVSSSIAVTVSPLPGMANTITGSATVCQTQSGVIYTVPAISNSTGYTWSVPLGGSIVSGANTNTITVDYSANADTGFVTVQGTNACGNGLSVDSFAVTVNPLPDAAGAITGDVTITICPVQTGVSYSVTPVNNATGYTWTVPTGAVITSGGNTNAILVNYSDTALSGNISVTPTNACGSGLAFNLNVDVDTVQSQSICVVTVDSTSTKNFLVWEKPVSTSIDSFFVYRDITGIYTKVGVVDYNSLSEFMDNTNGVNPNTAPYKYKVSAVDACGNESYLSAHHRTIHLQVSPASPFGYNLQWTDYEGFPVTKYRIMRDTLNTGAYHAADSTGFGTNTWTDGKNYQITDTIRYYIEIGFPGGGSCVSSGKNPDPMAANLNLSKSNINKVADTTVTSVVGVNDSYIVSVYPNPNSGLFTLELNQISGRGEVTVFNILGEVIQNLPLTEKNEKLQIDLSGYAKGVYQVEVKCGNSVINKKIIIQ